MATATLNVQSIKDEAEILSLIDSLHQANHDKNAAAFAAPFAPDAAVFNLPPRSSIMESTSKKSAPGSTNGPRP